MPGMINGKPVEPKIFMAVLYDPNTGHIAHYHRVLQFDPTAKVSKAYVCLLYTSPSPRDS